LRGGEVLDNVEIILSEIKSDQEIMRVRFTSSFLDNTADVFERHGWGTTEAFLLEKQNRHELKEQATALLKVLKIMEKHKVNRSVGRLIIKTLIPLKFKKEE
jgi:hypothetical protein